MRKKRGGGNRKRNFPTDPRILGKFYFASPAQKANEANCFGRTFLFLPPVKNLFHSRSDLLIFIHLLSLRLGKDYRPFLVKGRFRVLRIICILTKKECEPSFTGEKINERRFLFFSRPRETLKLTTRVSDSVVLKVLLIIKYKVYFSVVVPQALRRGTILEGFPPGRLFSFNRMHVPIHYNYQTLPPTYERNKII